MRNRLERILNVFDQDYCMKDNDHLLEINEEVFHNDEQILVNRLVKAAVAPDVRRAMDVEDEILSEIEARDTTIMLKDKKIEEQNKALEEQNKAIEEQGLKLDSAICLLYTNKMPVTDIAAQLSIREEEVMDALKRKGMKSTKNA